MSHSRTDAVALPRDLPRFAWPVAIAGAAFALLWLIPIRHLSAEWNLNPQYRYGWSVPFIALFIFYQRWVVRPAPSSPRFKVFAIITIGLTALLLLPARVVAVANPDWRMLSWAMSLAAVSVSLAMLNLAGGKPWLRHFAFPVLFFLVATPWPTNLEQFVVQGLMRADSAVTITLLNFAGTLAVQHGNAIELSTGMVGIDDACTGVRSLQATFMISLFLGELYRMRALPRMLLVVAGAALAFFCNIVRTFILCEVAATSGLDAIHHWHDPAGWTILVACLFGLWGISLWLRPEPATEATSAPTPARSSRSFPVKTLCALLTIWVGVIELSAAAWYRTRSNSQLDTKWDVRWPTLAPGFQSEPIPQASQDLLRYNEGGGAQWQDADGQHWLMYSFRWLPGRTAALFVKNHRPDICLPASGMTMERDAGIHLMNVNGVNLPIHAYRFEDQGRRLHVFYCYWNARSSYADDATAGEDWTAKGRLRAAWKGQRDVGSRMLELAVWGVDDDEQAKSALLRQLTLILARA